MQLAIWQVLIISMTRSSARYLRTRRRSGSHPIRTCTLTPNWRKWWIVRIRRPMWWRSMRRWEEEAEAATTRRVGWVPRSDRPLRPCMPLRRASLVSRWGLTNNIWAELRDEFDSSASRDADSTKPSMRPNSGCRDFAQISNMNRFLLENGVTASTFGHRSKGYI